MPSEALLSAMDEPSLAMVSHPGRPAIEEYAAATVFQARLMSSSEGFPEDSKGLGRTATGSPLAPWKEAAKAAARSGPEGVAGDAARQSKGVPGASPERAMEVFSVKGSRILDADGMGPPGLRCHDMAPASSGEFAHLPPDEGSLDRNCAGVSGSEAHGGSGGVLAKRASEDAEHRKDMAHAMAPVDKGALAESFFSAPAGHLPRIAGEQAQRTAAASAERKERAQRGPAAASAAHPESSSRHHLKRISSEIMARDAFAGAGWPANCGRREFGSVEREVPRMASEPESPHSPARAITVANDAEQNAASAAP